MAKLRNVTSRFSTSLQNAYDFYDCYYALDILQGSFPNELQEIETVLDTVNLTFADVIAPGGRKSPVGFKFDNGFYSAPFNWHESKITGDLEVTIKQTGVLQPIIIPVPNYLTGYKMDYYKNNIAIDLEWNSKDQTFDRDLTAYRAYYDAELIALGVIITRGNALKTFWGNAARTKTKGGASTTWFGKLKERIESDRAGKCPILIAAIKPGGIAGY